MGRHVNRKPKTGGGRMTAADRMELAGIPPELRGAIHGLAAAGAAFARAIQRPDPPEPASPQAWLRYAEQHFQTALAGKGLRWLDTGDGVVELDSGGDTALVLTVLDAAENLALGQPAGTIFSLYPAGDSAEASFLRPGTAQIAAGYILYGSRCVMVLTCGDGVRHSVLDPDSGRFQTPGAVQMPDCACEFVIDVASYRHWPRPVRAYIDDCLAGADGPHKRNFNTRWPASLVAATHHILLRGGVFVHPGCGEQTGGQAGGGLRLRHDCAPIALLAEQAGGRATDMCERVLTRTPGELGQRIAFAFGSPEKVARLAAYHDLPEPEISALFGHRGLFRA